MKTLGIRYSPVEDIFQYTFRDTLPTKCKFTKRDILSKTAQLFDPIGLLTPITIIPKLIIQALWKEQLGWDDSVPIAIKNQWEIYNEKLLVIDKIQIPRLIVSPSAIHIELHGF